MLEEGIEVIKALWTEDNATFEGQHFTLEGATSYPKPTQSPHPPFVIGGNGEKRTIPIAGKVRPGVEWDKPHGRGVRDEAGVAVPVMQ